jgi:hypothetical protein
MDLQRPLFPHQEVPLIDPTTGFIGNLHVKVEDNQGKD